MRRVLSYLAVLVVLVAGDAAWLSWFAPAVVHPTLGSILRDGVRWPAVILFYLLFALAIVIFPLSRAGSLTAALFSGALFGFFAYMTYDLTNLATIKVWTTPLALTDTAWGTVLSAVAASAGYAVLSARS